MHDATLDRTTNGHGRVDEHTFQEIADLRLKAMHSACLTRNHVPTLQEALELCRGGTSKTQQNADSRNGESPYEALWIQIDYSDRQKLYDRIDRRVDKMLEAGLADEAKVMLGRTGATSRQAIGHKELAPYLRGNISLQEASDNLKRETRRYAKRQLTWFRRNEKIHRLCADELGTEAVTAQAIALAKAFLNKPERKTDEESQN
jgi:tRNA dimethylallyltransferase